MTAGICLACSGRRVASSPYCTRCGWHEDDVPPDLDQAASFLAGAGLLANVFGEPIKGQPAGPPAGGTGGIPFGTNGKPAVTNSGRTPASSPRPRMVGYARPHMIALYRAERTL